MTTNDAIKDLINRYWKFDDQTPMSNWHDKQDLLKGIDKLFESEQPEIVPIGTKVMVTKRVYALFFDIGDIVTVIAFDNKVTELPYLCQNEDGMIQGLSREEFEIIEP